MILRRPLLLLLLAGSLVRPARATAWTPESWRQATRKAYAGWMQEAGPVQGRQAAWDLVERLVSQSREDLEAWRSRPLKGPDRFLGSEQVGEMVGLNLARSPYFEVGREGIEGFDLETMQVASEHPVTRLVWSLADRSLFLLTRSPSPPPRDDVERARESFRQALDLAERDLGPTCPLLVPLLERQAGWLREVSGVSDNYRSPRQGTYPRFRQVHVLGLALELLHRARGVRGEQPLWRNFSVLPAVRALIALSQEADGWKVAELPKGADLHDARSKHQERSRAYLDGWIAQGRWALIQGRSRRGDELYSQARKLIQQLEGEGSMAEAELLERWADALFWGPRMRSQETMVEDCRRALPLLRHAWEIRVAMRRTRDEAASQLLLRWSQVAEAAGLPDERADVEWKRYDLAKSLGWGHMRLPRELRRLR